MRVTIEKLVYGGAGLARTEHGVVFIPRTAPGDVVKAELIERKSDYSVARVIRAGKQHFGFGLFNFLLKPRKQCL